MIIYQTSYLDDFMIDFDFDLIVIINLIFVVKQYGYRLYEIKVNLWKYQYWLAYNDCYAKEEDFSAYQAYLINLDYQHYFG